MSTGTAEKPAAAKPAAKKPRVFEPPAKPGPDPFRFLLTVPHTFTVRAFIATLLLTAVAISAVVFLPPLYAGGALLGVSLLYLARKAVFSWTGGLVGLLLVILLIPVRRYALPIPLPFALEPYRFFIVAIAVCAIIALMIDPRFEWRRAVFGWPFAIFLGTSLVSISVNVKSISEAGLFSGVAGALINYLLMMTCFFVVRLALRRQALIEIALAVMVWGGVIVSFFAAIEKVTHQNWFLKLNSFLPLMLLREGSEAYRAGGARSFGSAQHPIALAVMLCMLIPLAIYLAKYAKWPVNEINRKIVYGLAVLMLFGGIATAVSRTAVVTLGVMFLVVLLFRPKVAGVLFLGAIPLMFLAFLLQPKVMGSMVGSFLDPNSLIASQYTSAGMAGAGRLADLGPAFALIGENPFFGTGLGSRIVIGETANSFILDNQFLGTLMESGAVGIVGLAALTLGPIIMLLVYAMRRTTLPQWGALAFTIAVGAAGYTTALFFYDAFGFMQTFMLYFVFLAIGAWAIAEAPKRTDAEVAGVLAQEVVDAGHIRVSRRSVTASAPQQQPESAALTSGSSASTAPGQTD